MDGDAVEYARQAQVLAYSYVASCAFLVWETCVSFGDEVEYLWSRPRLRWTKVAYILLRYYALALVILNAVTSSEAVCRALRLCGPPYCTRWYIFSTCSFQAVAILQQFLMASRVYALYGRSQYIFRFLAWAFVAEHATMILFTVLTARTIHWFGMCAPDHISMTSIGIGVPPLLYDALLLGLTVRECTRGRWRRATLPALLLRDGAWAFILVFCTYIVQALFFLVLSGPLASVAWPWQSAVSSLAACRLVLRTHRQGARRRASTPRPAESAGFALTSIEPGLVTKDDMSEW